LGRKTAGKDGRLKLAIGLVFLVALVLRVVYIVDLQASPLVELPVLDELYHIEWARELAEGDWIGSEVFFRAPLYPYLLGVLLAAFGGSLLAARLVQAVLGAMVPMAVYALARRTLGEREAWISAAAAALYPVFIYFNNELLIVSLIVLLDVLLLTAVLRADQSPTHGRWFGAGLLAGASTIARPSVAVFLPFLFVWMLARARTAGAAGVTGSRAATWREAWKRAGVGFSLLLAGVAVLVLPITLRNYAVGRDFVPVASQGGINFFIGNNAGSDGASAVLPVLGESWENEDAVRVAETQRGRKLRPSEVSDFWYDKGREFLLENPGQALRLYVRKFVFYWDSYETANNKDIYYFGGMSPVFRWLSWLNFGVVAPLAILGMLVLTRRNAGVGLMVGFVLSYMCGVLLFFVNARFRLPTVPFLIILGAGAVVWLVDLARRRSFRPVALAALLLVGVGWFVHHDFYGTHGGHRAQTHLTLGRASAAQGRLEEAVEEYRRAVELHPGYAKALNSMGLALDELGREDEALSAFLEAAESDSDLASARNNIGNLLMRRGDLEGAARWFEEAIELDSLTYQAYMNLAMIRAQQGDLAEAERLLRSSVVAEPEFEEGWDALGRVLEETGRFQEAAVAYSRAISTNPDYASAHHNLGVLLAMAGRYEEALVHLEAAARLAPGDPRIEQNLAQTRQLLAARRAGGD
jgi:Flp pilus assembly protein TadD/4-amino-4-deoxy-L-arabinose transferase-like glycosyltransferase